MLQNFENQNLIYKYTGSIFIFVLLMLMVTSVSADSFKTLLMPGPVHKVHEKYEQECEQCHDTENKAGQGKLCLQCHDHENVLDDITLKKGFHGRLDKSSQTECNHCHKEHKGRDAEIIFLNKTTFNHKSTDFLLKGEHKKISCSACHAKDKKYSEAPDTCYDCHEEVDVHKGEQGKKCGDCHSSVSWKESKFDHDDTDFKLTGKHEEVTCSSCHINKDYKETPKKCFGCHQINDQHQGSFGKKCDSCHKTSKWEDARFDHNKETDFSLYGKHKTNSCESCHIPGKIDEELPKKCFGCHKNDDTHKGRYGKKCNDCHSQASWGKQKFNHDTETDFKLLGKHKKVSCNQCHAGDLYNDEVGTKCIDCHKNDDIHKGEQGKKCDSCHNEKGWHDRILFDHDLTHFPLIGMHAVAQCEECHLTTEYSKTESQCNECHSDDDVHKTRLGTDCETCHTSNSWLTWFFDHDKATQFKIDGAHKEVGCYDCHKTESKGKLEADKDCIACHRSDDIHRSQFGRQCGDCHNTEYFKEINIK